MPSVVRPRLRRARGASNPPPPPAPHPLSAWRSPAPLAWKCGWEGDLEGFSKATQQRKATAVEVPLAEPCNALAACAREAADRQQLPLGLTWATEAPAGLPGKMPR